MLDFREVVYQQVLLNEAKKVYLGADIGGTNSNFGFFIFRDEMPILLLSLHFKSQQVHSFTAVIAQIIAYLASAYRLEVAEGVIAAAGVILKDRTFTKPTNLPWTIDTQEIISQTSMTKLLLANDFEVIGYGLEYIAPKSVVKVHDGVAIERANKAIIGAGTGFGKSILFWQKAFDRYVPVPSEGGHADFAGQHEQDFRLIEYSRVKKGYGCPLSWEDVLSGDGIQLLYSFFKDTNTHDVADKDLAANGLHPDEIFNTKDRDAHSKKTYIYYAQLYARCAKCFALDSLALGGLYIAGGIAAHNLPLFQHDAFVQEFLACNKQAALLQSIPIFVITDYNVSLYGAAAYMRLDGAF